MSETGNRINPLVAFVHHRWNLPVVAELHATGGAKYVTLLNRLGVGRSSLSATLEALIGLGMVRRNTGVGHPMRPEYLLTETGRSIGADCRALLRIIRRHDGAGTLLAKWSLPVLAAIGPGRHRFGELRACLPGASPRALSLTLKALENGAWVDHELIEAHPPTVAYGLAPQSWPVHQALEAPIRTLGRSAAA